MSVTSSTVGGPAPHGVCPPSHRPHIIVVIVALTLFWSCGGGATDVPEDTAGREAFMGAYVDLRTAALTARSFDIEDEVRDSILAVHGVTEQDLLDFIDTHGKDVEFMSALWTEVEARMVERRARAAGYEDDEGTD